MNRHLSHGLITAFLIFSCSTSWAEQIRVAVASNFNEAAKAIVQRFEMKSQHQVQLIFGSTGKHYAQIKNGAPFDAYFAADLRRPKLLDDEGIAIPGSRFTYAIGRIVLWSPKTNYVDPMGRVLEQNDFHHLSIANPKLAPYGKAAQQVLQGKGLWDSLRGRMVRGENIGQAFQYVKSGNAELGFVAYSQIKRPNQSLQGSLWEVPQNLYTPIKQQAVVLNESPAANEFMTFMRSPEVVEIIRSYGYDIPSERD